MYVFYLFQTKKADRMGFAWPPGIEISPVPVRRTIHRSSAISNGYNRTNLHLGGRPGFIAGESTAELLFLMLAELDPNVAAVAAQPVTMWPELDGNLFKTTPDFAVLVNGKGEIHEGKADRAYAKTKVRRRLAATARHVERSGWKFNVATTGDILNDPRFERVEDVWRRFRSNFDRLHEIAVIDAVGTAEISIADTLRRLRSSMGADAPTFEQILSLAANKRVFIEYEAPIGPASIIRYPDPAALPRSLLPRRHPANDLQPGEAI